MAWASIWSLPWSYFVFLYVAESGIETFKLTMRSIRDSVDSGTTIFEILTVETVLITVKDS